jgi:hypothetical protein
MPFPLAHPAAVLPFRRSRLRWLNFPALVIGSVVPDAGYIIRSIDSHEFWGSMMFGLPAGGLMLAAFYALRIPFISVLPARIKRSVRPICKRPIGPLWVVVLSLLIGIWTHVLWDSVTHTDGWIVEHVPILLTPVLQFNGRTARVCTILWYASSFIGTGLLFLSFEKWKQGLLAGETTGGRGRSMLQDAILAAILVVPISLIHHLIRNPIGYVMTAGFSLCLGFVFVVKMANAGASGRRPD